MSPTPHPPFRAAVACGGTGGHLFPGLAVAEKLQQRGCKIILLISPKDVDLFHYVDEPQVAWDIIRKFYAL